MDHLRFSQEGGNGGGGRGKVLKTELLWGWDFQPRAFSGLEKENIEEATSSFKNSLVMVINVNQI